MKIHKSYQHQIGNETITSQLFATCGAMQSYNKNELTSDNSKVTCKKCLKIMENSHAK
jgi:hypothetical protein